MGLFSVDSRHNHWLGLGFMLLATLCFSAKAIFVKLAYHYPIDAVTLLTLRMGFSLPFYLLVGVWAFRGTSQTAWRVTDWRNVLLLGVCGYYAASYFDMAGLMYISASFERLILYCYPTFVVLINAWVFKQALGRHEIAALVLSYLGIGIIYWHDASLEGPEVTLGVMLVLASAATFALYIVGSGRLVPRLGVSRFTVIAMSCACLTIVAHYGLTRPWALLLSLPWQVYALSLSIALISTVLPTFLMAAGIKRVGANRAAIMGAVGPVATTTMAVWVLGERFTLWHGLGIGIVLLAVGLLSLYSPRRAA